MSPSAAPNTEARPSTAPRRAGLGRALLTPLVGIALLLPAISLEAQQVQGTLVTAGAGRPLARGFVILQDTAGTEVARTLTDALGRFTLVAPAPGRYRLRTAIIGIQSVTSPMLTLSPDETLAYRMEVPSRAVQLTAIEVTGQRRCDARPSSLEAVSRVWEEARKALAAVSWTLGSDSLWYQVIKYERRLNPGSLKPVGGRARRVSGVTLGSIWGSVVSAQALSDEGYIRRNASGAWAHSGPDADVLLSNAFADDHCFYLTEHEQSDSLIGLAFEPVRQRDLPDVGGVLWIHRESAHLRYLDFEYTDLPWPISSRHIGGHVEFEQLPTGVWIVRHWWIRMPQLVQRDNNPTHRPRITNLKEEGGHVIQVRRADGSHLEDRDRRAVADAPADPADTEWRTRAIARSSPPLLRGVVANLMSGGPVENATVLLVDRDSRLHDVTVSTESGWFQMVAPVDEQVRMVVVRRSFRSVSSEPLELSKGAMFDLRANLRPLHQACDECLEGEATRVVNITPDSLMAAVQRRRERAVSLFSFTRHDLESLEVERLLDLMTQVPGAAIRGSDDDPELHLNDHRCEPRVFVDGLPAVRRGFLDAFPVQWIAAVEIFRSADETPDEFTLAFDNVTRCGTVVIWTIGNVAT